MDFNMRCGYGSQSDKEAFCLGDTIALSHAPSEGPAEDQQLLFRLTSPLLGFLTNQQPSVDRDLRSYVSTVHGIPDLCLNAW